MNNSMLQATQLMAQMRQEMMDSLRAELQSEFQSRVDQLENQCELLQRECKMLKEKQMRDQAKIHRLQGEVNALKESACKAERKAKYLEMVKNNENWEYPYDMEEFGELLLSIGYDKEESRNMLHLISDLKDFTIKMRRGEYLTPYVDLGEFSYYNEEMIPYLKEFAHALIEYRHIIDYMEDEIFIFSLNCAGLPNEVLDASCERLEDA